MYGGVAGESGRPPPYAIRILCSPRGYFEATVSLRSASIADCREESGIAGATSRLGCLQSIGVKLQWQIAADEAHSSGLDVQLFQLGIGILMEAFAEGTLIVNKLYQGHRCIRAADEMPAAGDAHMYCLNVVRIERILKSHLTS